MREAKDKTINLNPHLAVLLIVLSAVAINCGPDKPKTPPSGKTSPPPPATNSHALPTNLPATNRIPAVTGAPQNGNLQALARAVRYNAEGQPVAANFDQTKITDSTLTGLTNMPTLRALYLYDTAISDAGLKHIHALTNLVLLYLPATQSTPKGIAALRKKLPHCTVIYPNPAP